MGREMAMEWLKSAKTDLQLIEEILDKDHLLNVAAFHAQQCVEKSLKAILEYKEEKIPKVHSLLKLYALVQGYFTVSDIELLDILDQVYIDSRYPGDLGLLPNGMPGKDEISAYLDFARVLYDRVCALIQWNG